MDLDRTRSLRAARMRRWRKRTPYAERDAVHRYKAAHPDRIQARDAVAYAVRTGRLPKVSLLRCVLCGERATRRDHLKGYGESERLLTVPLCSSCDGEVIAARRSA